MQWIQDLSPNFFFTRQRIAANGGNKQDIAQDVTCNILGWVMMGGSMLKTVSKFKIFDLRACCRQRWRFWKIHETGSQVFFRTLFLGLSLTGPLHGPRLFMFVLSRAFSRLRQEVCVGTYGIRAPARVSTAGGEAAARASPSARRRRPSAAPADMRHSVLDGQGRVASTPDVTQALRWSPSASSCPRQPAQRERQREPEAAQQEDANRGTGTVTSSRVSVTLQSAPDVRSENGCFRTLAA